jgi:hypothetical protein
MADMSTPTRTPRTNASRRRAAEIRAWAADNGFELAPAGRIPAPVTAAFEAAASSPADPGPGAAGAAERQGDEPASGNQWDDDFATDDNELADESEPEFGPLPLADPGPPPAESGQEPEPGPPPPASLAEARARAQGGQGAGKGKAPRLPGWATAAEKVADRAGPQIKTTVKVTKAMREDIEGKLALILAVPVMAWETADPYCGGAASDRLDKMIKTAVPLICQSPEAINLFTRGTTWVLWLEFLSAVMPVAGAVYQHHIAHTVEIVPADGDQAAEPDPGQQYPSVFTGHIPAPRPA